MERSMGEEKVMNNEAEIVIVGAGVAGLATALALHRVGLRSVVLESSDQLRANGTAFVTWTNAWRALDALGVGDSLRRQHFRQQGLVVMSTVLASVTAEISYMDNGPCGGMEVRSLKRKVLLETLARELPAGMIRFSSKVVSIEDSGYLKLLHLADGSIIKAKLVIGCDGVNSPVARCLGFKKPSFAGRYAIRGFVEFEESHGFEPKAFHFVGKGTRYGIIPCDDTSLYWFFTVHHSGLGKETERNPAKMREFVSSHLGKVPDKIREVIEKTKVDDIIYSPLLYRAPWDILLGDVSKDNLCVAGDAFHPMTPDLGQGACSALEDAVVLAQCIAQVLPKRLRVDHNKYSEEEECERIKTGLKKYAKERKWRAADLVATAYVLGFFNQSSNKVVNLVRDCFLSRFLFGLMVKKTEYDCGALKAA